MSYTRFTALLLLPFFLFFFSCSKPTDLPSSPSPITGPTIIAAITNQVFAIDAATGKRRWNYASNGYITPPLKGDGVSYISSFDTLYTFNDSTSAKVWQYAAANYLGIDPILSNGDLFVADNNGNIKALDAANGNIKWGNLPGGPYWVSVYASGNILLASNDDNNLYAFNTANGNLLWKYAMPARGVAGYLTIDNGIVYAGTFDFKLLALDSSNGSKLWSFDIGDSLIIPPVVANGLAYTSKSDSRFYALDVTTGLPRWTYSNGDSVSFYTPTVSNNIVYACGSDNKLYALDAATGNLKWMYATSGYLNIRPVTANGFVYLCSHDSTIYALDAASGALKWSYHVLVNFIGPVVINGSIYMGGTDEKLYALNALDGTLQWKFSLGGYLNGRPFVF